ncbi:MAG: GNAT family N-acetyltransferase [Clostridia bacterium]|nr:GNAT family N-acetyltransferase [Clostridia bacterium]
MKNSKKHPLNNNGACGSPSAGGAEGRRVSEDSELIFEPFSLDALKKVMPYIKANSSLCSDISAGYLYMWNEGADIGFCVRNRTFTVRQKIGEQPAFSYPIGEDPDGMIAGLEEYAYKNHLPLRFYAVDEERLAALQNDPRLQPSMQAFDRRWSDYIYPFGDALNFRGNKYSGQRNHINKFRSLYGEPVLRPLGRDDRGIVAGMMAEFAREHSHTNALERTEREMTLKLFDACGELGLYAAGLFVEDRLAAFSIGEITGDMLMIHVEKALMRYEGIYPAMYSYFVRWVSGQMDHPLKYVNREDDSGDPGLRMSKMQYHPARIVNKYLVHVKSPALKMEPVFSISNGDIVLTEIRESDKEAYLKLNTDIVNNRYWGYDYREDITITGPVDENTFYDSVMYDMRAGDSVNFAVRLSESGEMIGEAILWNFASDGTAELGCRIMPEYHGKGYGRSAFRAAYETGADLLGLAVRARCFRENEASRQMITGSGFVLTREDAECLYFEPAEGRHTERPSWR